MYYYYDIEKANNGELYVHSFSEELISPIPENQVAWYSEDGSPFIGYPIIDSVSNQLRQATRVECVLAGVEELLPNEVIQNDQIVTLPPEPLSFLEQKQIKISLMNITYEQYISAISTETDEDKASYIVPQTEVATFDMQKLEAEAWQIDDSVATPFIDGIALGRQMDRVLLIQKVLAKAMGYSQYVSVLTGKRQHIEDLLKQARTQEALDAIDVEALYN